MNSAPPQTVPAESDYEHLPERVSRVIQKQQDASERLIGWSQLVIVILFGALYAVSPKTFSADVPFTPVPWALGFYLGFTVIRLFLAHRGRLPDAILYASVVIDMALLLGLIWSFHIQYTQPPSFYLKVPTLLYVFIFIALRALRFEARFVVFAGIVAAVGWTILVVYAIYASGGVQMITRNYVYYMTSNSILIGAELDKIISILTVTAILALAISRARRLLTRAVAERAAAQDLSRFFSPEIVRQITASEQEVGVGQGRARTAAILNCDIRGFTGYATTVDPNELMATLAEYQRLIVPIIQTHGGAIDKFMGDGIMATFGAAASSETYAADARRATDAIVTAVEDWKAGREADGRVQLRVGVAVATGQIIFGAVGDDTRLEYTVIGDAVNRSAKLEKFTKIEKVRAMTDAVAYDMAVTQGYRAELEPERRGQRRVEGLENPVDLIVLAN